mmetsp:Transcript_28204/g.43398  ORF Transcript_28204/g.43398 Transcript_28204/m.43398 type:complete len:450 (-) Transcript_28204:197-1546(-)
MVHERKRRAISVAFAVTMSSCCLASAFVVPSRQTVTKESFCRTTSLSPFEKLKESVETDIKQQESSFDPLKFFENINDSQDSEMIIHSSEVVSEEDSSQLGIWAARGILLVVAVLWGTNFASVKYLETLCFHPPCNHPPSEAAFARFGVAALVSIPLLIKQRKDVILGGLECGIWISMGYITQALALVSIPASKCAFICSLTVVVVPLISSVFFGKEMKLSNLLSAAIAITGVGVLEGIIDAEALVGVGSAAADSTPVFKEALGASETAMSTVASTNPANFMESLGIGKGDLLALGQPLGFGFSFMRIEHYVEKFKDVPNRVLTISAAQCVAVGLLSLFWVLYDYHGALPDFGYMLDWHRLVAVAWTGIMTTVVAIYLEGFALQTASATEAALTFASEPVWASLFGAYLLRERLNFNSYVGGAVILGACVLGALSDMPNDEANENGEKS